MERERSSAKGNSKILQANKSRTLGRLMSDTRAIIGLIWLSFNIFVRGIGDGPERPAADSSQKSEAGSVVRVWRRRPVISGIVEKSLKKTMISMSRLKTGDGPHSRERGPDGPGKRTTVVPP